MTLRLSCTVPRDVADTVVALCDYADAAGCIETGVTSNHVRIDAFFKSIASLHRAEFSLFSLGISFNPVRIDAVPDRDWNEEWKKNLQPVRLAGSVWVFPAWLPPPAEKREAWIRIEPKSAFGTGHHESTRCAASALYSLRRGIHPQTRIIDIGTGSGILCFLALHLGAQRPMGIEIDPACAANLAENRELNESNADFFIGTLEAVSSAARFDIAVMNIIRADSEPLLSRVKNLLLPTALLIWSGILESEKHAVQAAARRTGFVLKRELNEGEWWCGLFARSPAGKTGTEGALVPQGDLFPES